METTATEISNTNDGTWERKLHGWPFVGVLVALMLTMLMAALDQTVVDTAIPRIIGDLHGFGLYSWLVTIYLLTSTTVIPLVGKLSDQFGRKWFLLGSITLFLLGSALAGTSQTMVELIVFRAVQGLGAGGLQTLIFTSIGDIFPPLERSRWQGVFAAIFALASVIGPALGGWITDYASWRWVFYVNLPVGILALLAIVAWLPNTITDPGTRGKSAFRQIDIAGALTAAGGTVSLLLGLSWGGQAYPWLSFPVLGTLAAAAILFGSFFIIEKRSPNAILPLDLFRNQTFTAGALLSFTVGMALFSVVVYLPLFVQGVLGQNATSSGVVTTPLVITLAIFSTLSGIIISRLGGRYRVLSIVGAVVLSFSIFLVTLMNASTPLLEVTRNMIIVGIGMGIIQPIINLATQNTLPRNRLGAGTGAVTYMRSMGSTLATALLGTIVNTTYVQETAKNLPAAAQKLPASVLKAATDQQVLTNPAYRKAVGQALNTAAAKAVQVPAGAAHDAAVTTVVQQMTALFNQIVEGVRVALESGIHEAFTTALFISFGVIVITFFLKDAPVKKAAVVVITDESNEAKELDVQELVASV